VGLVASRHLLSIVSCVASRLSSALLIYEGQRAAGSLSFMDGAQGCVACGRTGARLLQCSACKKVKFCNADCQRRAWHLHRFDCSRSQQGSSAYVAEQHLSHSCHLQKYLLELSDTWIAANTTFWAVEPERLQALSAGLDALRLPALGESSVLVLGGVGIAAVQACLHGAGSVFCCCEGSAATKVARELFKENSGVLPAETQVEIADASVMPQLRGRRFRKCIVDASDIGCVSRGLFDQLASLRNMQALAHNSNYAPWRILAWALLGRSSLDEVDGFCMVSFDNLRVDLPYEQVDLQAIPWQTLSKPFMLHAFDLQNDVEPSDSIHQITLLADGEVNAVVYWFEFMFDGENECTSESLAAGSNASSVGSTRSARATSFSMSPNQIIGGSRWKQVFRRITCSRFMRAGEKMELKVHFDKRQFHFNMAMQSVPRCDNMWLNFMSVPRWHWNMLEDTARNECFKEAIEKAIELMGDDTLCLDIGCGAGLLSMQAARAAKRLGHSRTRIIACEVNTDIADVAQQIIKHAGLADTIEVYACHSSALELPRRADVCIFEVFGQLLHDEHVLETMDQAHRCLFSNRCICIPSSASMLAMPIHWSVASPSPVFGATCMRSLGGMAHHIAAGISSPPLLQEASGQWVALAKALPIFEVDFHSSLAISAAIQATAAAQIQVSFNLSNQSHVCNAVVIFFELYFWQCSSTLSTSPMSPRTHWQPKVCVLPRPVSAGGGPIPICLAMNKGTISKAWIAETVVSEQLLSPRWALSARDANIEVQRSWSNLCYDFESCPQKTEGLRALMNQALRLLSTATFGGVDPELASNVWSRLPGALEQAFPIATVTPQSRHSLARVLEEMD